MLNLSHFLRMNPLRRALRRGPLLRACTPDQLRIHRRGFTLIELLIVIAIIALLAAILFPVFGRARESARRASCQSNLKQIGLAFEQYKNDFDGWIAPKKLGTTSSTTYAWPTMVQPYIKNRQVFTCPSASIGSKWSAPDPEYIDVAAGSARQRFCDYGTNDGSGSLVPNRFLGTLTYSRNLIQSDAWSSAGFTNDDKTGFLPLGVGTSTASLNEAAVEDAAGTIHIIDAITGSNTAATTTCGGTADALTAIDEEVNTDAFPHSETSKPAYRHFGGFNAMFGDGHVKWVKWGTTEAADWSIQAD